MEDIACVKKPYISRRALCGLPLRLYADLVYHQQEAKTPLSSRMTVQNSLSKSGLFSVLTEGFEKKF